jgi:hypothetical protein
MPGPISGTFTRTDRVQAVAGSNVRLVFANQPHTCRATLLELSLSDVLLSDVKPPPLGTQLSVAITLSGRYLEFELPGMVTWHHRAEFGVSFEYLTARQTYGLSLAIDVMGRKAQAQAQEPAKPTRAARR